MTLGVIEKNQQIRILPIKSENLKLLKTYINCLQQVLTAQLQVKHLNQRQPGL
jgi:hypothetical protein